MKLPEDVLVDFSGLVEGIWSNEM